MDLLRKLDDLYLEVGIWIGVRYEYLRNRLRIYQRENLEDLCKIYRPSCRFRKYLD